MTRARGHARPDPAEPGAPLRPAPADPRKAGEVGRFLAWLERERGLRFGGYAELHHWSVSDLDGFWSAIWDFFEVRGNRPDERVLADRRMPGAQWFPGATLNYAEHAVTPPGVDGRAPAVLACSQTREPLALSWAELGDAVARVRGGLRRLGVRRGDRVAAYLPNVPETVIAYLATVSLGAVWAACAPELGVRAVLDRLGQVTPSVLLTVSGYDYGARHIDRVNDVAAIRAGLPSAVHVVEVPYGREPVPGAIPWDELAGGPAEPGHERVPFDHPMAVLFSSGTTGKPKAIVHGHGGLLLEHLKNHTLSWDLRPGDRFMWFTTTSWMVWNTLVSALLRGATIVLLDGDPAFPGLDRQWELAEEIGVTFLGLSPAFIATCRERGLNPARSHDLSALRQIGAAGSPLSADAARWIHDEFGPEVLLNVGSGGTDVCSGIVQGNPLLPVRADAISGPCLGVAATAYDDEGREIVGGTGELVITAPMPSMPLGFWGDHDGSRLRAAYFDRFPGVWRHGDWIRFHTDRSCVVVGRSDATLNRGGVRLGTHEFYDELADVPEVSDSLVVHLEDPGGGAGRLVLFVVPSAGAVVDDRLRTTISTRLRTSLSPRHSPDEIVAVDSIPRTRTGKRLEVPIKRLLQGADPDEVVSVDSLADPTSLAAFRAVAVPSTKERR